MGHGPRADATARAERCWRLRIRGRTWQEIADEEGFRHRRAAQKAVEGWLKRNPVSDVETLRRAMGDGITMLQADLFDSLEECRRRGQHIRVAQLGQVILDSYEKQAKLWGLHVAVPTQVDVTVHQSISQLVEDTKAKLLAAVEGEVLDVREIPLQAALEAAP